MESIHWGYKWNVQYLFSQTNWRGGRQSQICLVQVHQFVDFESEFGDQFHYIVNLFLHSVTLDFRAKVSNQLPTNTVRCYFQITGGDNSIDELALDTSHTMHVSITWANEGILKFSEEIPV